MDTLGPWMLLIVPVFAVAIAGTLLWAIGRPQIHPSRRLSTSESFVIRDGRLTGSDATSNSLPDSVQDWLGLRAWLGSRFGDLPLDLGVIESGAKLTVPATGKDDAAHLTLAARKSAHFITLYDPHPPSPGTAYASGRELSELEQFRQALHDAPCAIYITDNSGAVLWRNDRFKAFSSNTAASIASECTRFDAETGSVVRPCVVRDAAGADLHLEVTTVEHAGSLIHYAIDTTRLVRSDAIRREFVQTLTKTFADLTVGLAVFDRNRQLALFNPALVDLTSLPVDFLSAKPAMLSVFDRLRDHHVLPEPKSYTEWREQINAMIETAAGGHYSESWSLPNGLTYRVTGRPHPGGAVAFLFEDVSDEITLTRRFRTQLELRQLVLDRLDEAIAVFGQDNVLVFCNTACAGLLGIDPDSSFADMKLEDVLPACQTAFPDKEFWCSAADKISGAKTGAAIEKIIWGTATKACKCRLAPLTGGAILLRISEIRQPALENTSVLS